MKGNNGSDLWREMSQRARSVVVNFVVCFTSRVYSMMKSAVHGICPMMKTAVQKVCSMMQTAVERTPCNCQCMSCDRSRRM